MGRNEARVKVCDIPCLFHDARIERSTVPEGMYLYEIGDADDSGAEPARVQKKEKYLRVDVREHIRRKITTYKQEKSNID